MSKTRVEHTPQGGKVRAWRERVGLTVEALADASGYSQAAIYQFERGVNGYGDQHSEWAWQRYRLVCAAITHQMRTGKEFTW